MSDPDSASFTRHVGDIRSARSQLGCRILLSRHLIELPQLS